jgi:ferredoxin
MGKSIIFCNCGGETIKVERLRLIEEFLINANATIIKLTDLCGLAGMSRDRLKNVFRNDNEYLIIGCYSRSLRLLLEQADPAILAGPVRFVNFIELTNQQVFEEISSFCKDNTQTQSLMEITSSRAWPSWFPVIDYNRCSGCGQCADFCLFGVYQKDETRVLVINPQQCKNNCPACARICPETAIIFPKYKLGGAISGSDTIDDIAEQKRLVLDTDAILGDDIYKALGERKLKRQTIIRSEAIQAAVRERSEALRKNS